MTVLFGGRREKGEKMEENDIAHGEGQSVKGPRISIRKCDTKRLIRKGIREGWITEKDLIGFIRMKRNGIKGE